MILHILKKDARRLWPHIMVTLVLLSALARQDRWRSDFVAGSTEGWLNLLLPLAWACLIGLVMEQEPLVGDRNFWTTRPYRRHELLSAKALFASLFIHAPYFLASSYILALRGFSPLRYIPNLLWNQLLLAAALILPAMALAALVRNFTQFILEVVAVAAAAILLSGALTVYERYWFMPIDNVRGGLTILVAACVAIAIIWMQYSRARLLFSHIVGVAGGVVAGAIFGYLMPQSAFAVRSTMSPARTEIALHISRHQEALNRGWIGDQPMRRVALLPVAFSGVPEGIGYHYSPLWTEIIGPDGKPYRAATRAMYRSFAKIVFEASLVANAADEQAPKWLLLRLDGSLFERWMSSRVKVRGEVAVTLYRLGETSWMPVGVKQEVSGVGRCESPVVEGRYPGEDQLKVECESPAGIPAVTRVRLWHPVTGEEWTSRTGAFGTFIPGPRGTWLSPIDRRQTVFTLTREPRQSPGSKWLVPAEYLSTAKIAITPEQIVGYSIVRYEFSDLALSDYLAPPSAR